MEESKRQRRIFKQELKFRCGACSKTCNVEGDTWNCVRRYVLLNEETMGLYGNYAKHYKSWYCNMLCYVMALTPEELKTHSVDDLGHIHPRRVSRNGRDIKIASTLGCPGRDPTYAEAAAIVGYHDLHYERHLKKKENFLRSLHLENVYQKS